DLYGAKKSDMERIVDYEEDEFETNHSIVGGLMARAWGMPADMHLAIKHHHDTNIDHVTNMGDSTLWFLLRLTDYIINFIAQISDMDLVNFTLSKQFKLTGLTNEFLEEYGLNRDHLRDLFYDVRTQLIPTFLEKKEGPEF
ncbi:HDOD domain-containing protein, partial [Magnetococcales bacterium HHB-1]